MKVENVPNVKPGKPEPYYLAIESSGRVGSAALGKGPNLLEEIVFSGKMRHSSELFPALTKLLDRAGCTPGDIQTLCFTAGPGSFTGIRIAVTAAKMMNFAQKTNLVAVDTLDVIAENATEYVEISGKECKKIIPILDAKQNQFFTAIYAAENNKWRKEIEDALIPAETLIQKIMEEQSASLAVLGEGLLYHSDLFKAHGIQILPSEYWPARARNVLKIGYKLAQKGCFSDPLTLVPSYIRQPDALEKWTKKKTQ